MERSEWLHKMRAESETLYDHLAPAYWVTFGFYPNAAHRQFVAAFLDRLPPASAILSAACGAGRYDEMLVERGAEVLGIDQSARMLARAREVLPEARYPRLAYRQMALQDIDFGAAFDGIVCIDALEHVSPEDWPPILRRFQRALKPGGLLYITVEEPDWDEVREAYEREVAQGLPVVMGEVVTPLGPAFGAAPAPDSRRIEEGSPADLAVYHYYPSNEQVRAWLAEAGLALEEEASGDGYWHLLLRKA